MRLRRDAHRDVGVPLGRRIVFPSRLLVRERHLHKWRLVLLLLVDRRLNWYRLEIHLRLLVFDLQFRLRRALSDPDVCVCNFLRLPDHRAPAVLT